MTAPQPIKPETAPRTFLAYSSHRRNLQFWPDGPRVAADYRFEAPWRTRAGSPGLQVDGQLGILREVGILDGANESESFLDSCAI